MDHRMVQAGGVVVILEGAEVGHLVLEDQGRSLIDNINFSHIAIKLLFSFLFPALRHCFFSTGGEECREEPHEEQCVVELHEED